MVLVLIARLPYIFPHGLESNLLPEEYYNFRVPLNKALLLTHLASVLPAGALAVLQFVPSIRTRFMAFHRISGRVINTLTLISTICGWAIAPVSFGGDPSIQLGVYVLGLMTMWSVIAGWRAIRRLRIDEHRVWLIRAWAYQMSIVTMRLIMPIGMIITGIRGGFYTASRS
jgi:uncharacterized membrane protein YozB (DUF420 family)